MARWKMDEGDGIWSSLYRNEDWWAIWVGFIILGLALTRLISWIPRLGGWTINPLEATGLAGASGIIPLGLLLLTLTGLAIFVRGEDGRRFLMGFPILFSASLLVLIISCQRSIRSWGLESPLWALIIGLLLNNLFKIPDWLRAAAREELFIKIGLVLLGAEVLFNDLLAAGVLGLFEVTIGLSIIWYFCYYLATRLGLSRSFASILASATSICGVSAAIASGWAVRGDPKEVSHTISLVLLFAIPMTIIMPAIGRVLGMPPAVVGAWIGGTIDTTPAVVAAGAIYGEVAMKVASIVKMSQNIMIGLVAFTLALYWALRVERRPEMGPRPIEIWFRFPKFVVGFMAASLIFSFILVPMMGYTSVRGVLSIIKEVRGWLFTLAFISIGLKTRFGELVRVGAGRPLLVFLAASFADLALSLASAYLFFGGILFPTVGLLWDDRA
ncbi:putative sulfate exporter family transporter [Candidatus Bathyarchaeota archaeon]|nr:putative sulfate exporter family transporter [Candidatus Bathyarchaeota archaeon]